MVHYGICPVVIFGLVTILLRFEIEHLSLLVGRYVPTKVIRERNSISLCLMINAGMLLTSSRRLIFGGPVIALWLTTKSLSAVK